MADDDLNAPPAGSGEDDDAKIWEDLAKLDQPGDDDPDTPEKDGAPAEADPPDTTPEPVAAPAEDPWADAPEPLRSARDALQRERDEALEKARRAAGSVSGQTRKINELIAENERLRKTQRTDEPAGPTDDKAGAPEEDPELARAREEYPEVVLPLERSNEQLRERLDEIGSEVRQRFARMDEDEQERYIDNQAVLLAEAHPDYNEVANSSEFNTWAQTQPPMVQQAIEKSFDAEELSLVLSLYKQSTAPAKPAADEPKPAAPDRRQAQLDSATTPRTKSPPQINPGKPEDDEGLWNYYAERDRREAARNR